MKLEWSNKYEIGIKSIDDQHKVLIILINQLSDAIQIQNKDLCYEALVGLVEYTMNHFIYEETIFEKIGYEETLEHKEEHDRFTSKIIEVMSAFEDDKPLNEEIINFLNNWLLHHILKVDLAYVSVFKKHGIN